MHATMLRASCIKELRLLRRDPEGLAILFVMPVVFVVIMSLALQDFFDGGGHHRFDVVVVDADHGVLAESLAARLSAPGPLRAEWRPASDVDPARERLRAELREGHRSFGLVLPPGTSAKYAAARLAGDTRRLMSATPAERTRIEFFADPALRADVRALARAQIERLILAAQVLPLLDDPPADPTHPPRLGMVDLVDAADGPDPHAAGRPAPGAAADPTTRPGPDATQQNVPAYSVLAMFLLVVPLSGAFIRERAQGSLTRLRSMPVPGAIVIAGKVLPYLVINLLQCALCLAIGRYLLPALGGTALRFGASPAGLLLLAVATSLAAIGFGLLVAMFARTTEQATAFGAAAVLVLAALGGIMVPTTLMPPLLQQAAAWSPLGWALDGFIDLFVRDARVLDVLPRVLQLTGFGLLCLLVACWRFATLSRHR